MINVKEVNKKGHSHGCVFFSTEFKKWETGGESLVVPSWKIVGSPSVASSSQSLISFIVGI